MSAGRDEALPQIVAGFVTLGEHNAALARLAAARAEIAALAETCDQLLAVVGHLSAALEGFPPHEHVGDREDPKRCVYTLPSGERCLLPLLDGWTPLAAPPAPTPGRDA